MKVGGDTRTFINSRHPGNEEAIARGLSRYPAFRELCEDYRRCAMALEEWRHAAGNSRPERVREYEDLLGDLWAELEGWFGLLSEERAGSERTGIE